MDCPNGCWCMQFKDWLNVAILVITAIAIVVGPIVAVRLTLRLEDLRENVAENTRRSTPLCERGV